MEKTEVCGLSTYELKIIRRAISNYPEIDKAIVFGSRAKGNYHEGSDVDLAIVLSNTAAKTINKLSFSLNEETNIPYHFDILNINAISNAELLEHIQRVGICIFDRNLQH